jgi:hypothetical protein
MSIADATPTPDTPKGHPLTEPNHLQYAALGRYVAVLLGSNVQWDAGITSMIANSAAELPDFPPIAGQTTKQLAFWRAIADRIGIEHDSQEADFDDEA